MSPCWLASAGIGTTLRAGSLSGSDDCSSLLMSGGLLARFVAQFTTQDLADVGFRQLGAKLHFPWTLVAGEMGTAMRQHRVGGKCCVLLHNEELHRFARSRVRNPNGRTFKHSTVHRNHRFDFVRIHVETRDEDHVLFAI